MLVLSVWHTMPLTVKCLQHMLRIIGNRSSKAFAGPVGERRPCSQLRNGLRLQK